MDHKFATFLCFTIVQKNGMKRKKKKKIFSKEKEKKKKGLQIEI